VDTALEFLAAPASGAGIVRIIGNCRARLAADACVALVILRQIAQMICGRVFPNFAPGPIGKKADFEESLAAGQAVMFGLFQILARGRLFPAETCKPNIERFERFQQWVHFAQLAALRGVFSIQNAKGRFLFFHGLFRKNVYEVEAPFSCQVIAELIRFREVVARFEEEHRNVGHALS